ncbi:MAG: cell filamentation protein Fic [Cytophagaceae bacterium]|nr:MAG: cell filamentation protein Fic [Cytophagaceae bacterium]
MDWGQYDQEGAIRQRYLEIDDRIEDAKQYIARSRWTLTEFQEMYDISWIYHENGLEGVVLTYPEIKSAVDNKIISDVSLLPTYRDIKNQKSCIDAMREKAASRRFNVTVPFLKDLHAKLVHSPEDAVVWRKDIPIHRTYFHEIAPPQKIEAQLQDVLDYLKDRSEPDLHFVELAANVHHRFMRCFPFAVHSGMMGRLLLNFVLARAQALPVIIHASDRQRYYEALRGSERDFRLFIVEAIENSLENAIRFFASQERGAIRGAS